MNQKLYELSLILFGGAFSLLTTFVMALINHNLDLKKQKFNLLTQKEIDIIFDFKDKLIQFYYLLENHLFFKIENEYSFTEQEKKSAEELASAVLKAFEEKYLDFIRSYENAQPYLKLNKSEKDLLESLINKLLALKCEIECDVQNQLEKYKSIVYRNITKVNPEKLMNEVNELYI